MGGLSRRGREHWTFWVPEHFSSPRGPQIPVFEVRYPAATIRTNSGFEKSAVGQTFFFIKFFECDDHARKFVQGQLHAKRLSWFKTLESGSDESGRIDRDEGTSGWLQPGRGVLTLNGEVVEGAQIQVQPHRLNHWHVFCLYAGHSGDLDMDRVTREHDVEAIRRQLMVPDKCLSFGKHAVIIKSVDEFVSRVAAKAKAEKYRFTHGRVQYYDPDSFHGILRDEEAVFRKQKRLEYQREYRIAFDTGTLGCGALNLDVGDLSDITLRLDATELNGEQWIGGISSIHSSDE